MSVQIIDSNIIKKTQDSLGKIIKRPPMTEKLLSKPPFRFLHDIITSVIKTTGFMNGLFTELEMNSDNVKEKEAKVIFLQKVIDMISLVLGKTLSARPSRIILGSEPEKTNEMLLMLAEAINKKIDNGEYVQRVLQSDNDLPKKKKESCKSEEKDLMRKDHKTRSSSPSRKDVNENSKQNVKHSVDEKQRDRSKHEGDRKKETKKESKRGKEGDERILERTTKKVIKQRNNDRSEMHMSKNKMGNEDSNDENNEKQERKRHKKKESSKGTRNVDDEIGKKEKILQRPSSAKGCRQQFNEAAAECSHPDIGEPSVTVPKASKNERPSSARPAPPKPKKKKVEEESRDESWTQSQVIVDKPQESDVDCDDFILREYNDELKIQDESQNEDIKGEHGILVKKILNTKSELEANANLIKKAELEISKDVSDISRVKDRQPLMKEIEKIRSLIQGSTRNINPLGKTLDFLQEDMDSMLKEMELWADETRQNKKLLNEEARKTEATLEPLKAQLKDLEISLSQHQEQISAVKSNILMNEKKFVAMLNSVAKQNS